jgi:hypothetical protein
MRNLSVLSGWLGVIVFLVAVVGRFYQQATITIAGYSFQSQTFLVLANTFLLIGIFLHLTSSKRGG